MELGKFMAHSDEFEYKETVLNAFIGLVSESFAW